jgi:hypothetical protein
MCGAPNEDDAVFCGNCGAALTSDEAPSEAAIESTEEVVERVEDAAEGVPDELIFGPEEEDVVEAYFPVEEVTVEPAPMPAPPPPPRPYRAAPAVPQTSGMAVAALVMGIVGLVLLPLIGSILALIFGYAARRDIRSRPNELTGEGLAVAGIVMGWIAIVLTVIGIVVFGGMMGCGLCAAFAEMGY